LGMVLFL